MSLLPLACFERIERIDADQRYKEWGHYLGACERPFGRQDFGMYVAGDLVSVATSASTVSAICGGYDRGTIVELARLCSSPGHRWATRVCLRLWRELAATEWAAAYWPVQALVSYQSAVRHSGDIYRFDGWTRVGEMAGSGGGGTWTRAKARERKVLWVYRLDQAVESADG